MRELIFSDAFHIAKIAKKIGVAKIMEVQREMAADYKLDPDNWAATSKKYEARIADLLLSGIADAEQEIIQFVAALTGDKISEVKNYSIDKVIEVAQKTIEINGKDKLLGFFTKVMR